jgi:tetratricopeptide (TPR) repeat protein
MIKMNNKYVIGLIGVFVTLLIATTVVVYFTSNSEVRKKEIEIDDLNEFEQFREMFSDDATPKEIEEAKNLFEQASQLERDGESDKAQKVWDEFFALRIMNDSIGDELFSMGSFEDFKKMFKADISEQQLEEVKKLFDQATKLEVDGKTSEASEVWNQIFSMDIFNNEMSGGVISLGNFDEFKQLLKEDLSEETLAEVESLFTKANEYEKNEETELAQQTWEQIFSMDIFNTSISIEQ